MSLDWDCSDCAAYKQVKSAQVALEAAKPDAALDDINDECGMSEFIALRDSVVWATLCTHFPPGDWAITEKNWREMYTRLVAYERLYGASRHKGDEDIFFQPEEVRGLIELSTNAGTYTNRQFDTEIMRRIRQGAKDDLRSAAEKTAA
jgi:hypothetical protein